VSRERWERIKELYARGARLPREERAAFVAEHAAGDETLAAELAALLDNATEADRFLDSPLDAPTERASGERQASFELLGCRVGDFELVEELGVGSTGTVFLARQEPLGRLAAVKILAPSLCSRAERVERFKREAQVVSGLRHPHIVTVYGFDQQHGVHWIAMEHVDGASLKDLLEGRAPAGLELDVRAPRVAAALIEKVARAVQYCHERGLVHRDIKPANVLVDRHGEPRLADFGLVRDDEREALTQTGTLSGTPHYMSPEQARALGRDVDKRTDIYSLGAVLYELLAGRPPFATRHAGEVLHAVVHDEPEHLGRIDHRIPRPLIAICTKALRKTPVERYVSAGELADDLLRFLGGYRVVAPAPSALRNGWYFALRHRAAIGAVLLACSVLVFAVLSQRPSNAADERGQGTDTAGATEADSIVRFFDQMARAQPGIVSPETREILTRRLRALPEPERVRVMNRLLVLLNRWLEVRVTNDEYLARMRAQFQADIETLTDTPGSNTPDAHAESDPDHGTDQERHDVR